MLTISKAAKLAGVGIETIRFYERKGLIERPAKPGIGGYRAYPQKTIEKIRFIRQAQELGFSLKEIDELLSLHSDPGADCSNVQQQAIIKLAEVDAKIARLQQIHKALSSLIDVCPRCGPLGACSIMGAMMDSKDM